MIAAPAPNAASWAHAEREDPAEWSEGFASKTACLVDAVHCHRSDFWIRIGAFLDPSWFVHPNLLFDAVAGTILEAASEDLGAKKGETLFRFDPNGQASLQEFLEKWTREYTQPVAWRPVGRPFLIKRKLAQLEIDAAFEALRRSDQSHHTRLQGLRQYAGLSVKDVAAEAKCGPSRIRQWERRGFANGDTGPGRATVCRIVFAYEKLLGRPWRK